MPILDTVLPTSDKTRTITYKDNFQKLLNSEISPYYTTDTYTLHVDSPDVITLAFSLSRVLHCWKVSCMLTLRHCCPPWKRRGAGGHGSTYCREAGLQS